MICVGDFGTWPDPKRLDRATKLKSNSGDFAELYLKGWQAPIQTLYISGVHEDHKWLKHRYDIGHMEVLNNVHWLANGNKTVIGDADSSIRVTGFGKVYSEETFNGNWNKKSYRHFTKNEFEKACSSGPTDILVLHELPTVLPIKKIIFATRPRLILHKAYKKTEEYKVMGIPTHGLIKGEVRDIIIR